MWVVESQSERSTLTLSLIVACSLSLSDFCPAWKSWKCKAGMMIPENQGEILYLFALKKMYPGPLIHWEQYFSIATAYGNCSLLLSTWAPSPLSVSSLTVMVKPFPHICSRLFSFIFFCFFIFFYSFEPWKEVSLAPCWSMSISKIHSYQSQHEFCFRTCE